MKRHVNEKVIKKGWVKKFEHMNPGVGIPRELESLVKGTKIVTFTNIVFLRLISYLRKSLVTVYLKTG